MVENVLDEFKNLKIDQLGYVYKDVKKQASLMEKLWGIKFTFMEQTHHIEYRGKEGDYTLLIGFSRMLNTQIELIQWISGEGVHKEFIDKGREGLQHISVFVEDLDAHIEGFKKLGFEVAHYGVIGRRQFAFMDTEEAFGIMIELQGPLKKRKKK